MCVCVEENGTQKTCVTDTKGTVRRVQAGLELGITGTGDDGWVPARWGPCSTVGPSVSHLTGSHRKSPVLSPDTHGAGCRLH
jgi:hypothetical protein